MKSLLTLIVACSLFLISQISGQVSAELIQYPDISDDNICFTYGDDLWLVPKSGGDAHRLISPIGRETSPKFSPDGKTLAYQANYDGNTDIYTMSINGGVPSRVTGHGMNETLLGWTPDGQHLIYASSAAVSYTHLTLPTTPYV